MSLAALHNASRLPPYLFTTDHRQRVLTQLRSKETGLEKYIYLNGLKDREPNLFYEILLNNLLEIVPILYTPTVSRIVPSTPLWRSGSF
jgi:malate dehydrogenase (oxaloacetate-decarboxylating)(NADP+)